MVVWSVARSHLIYSVAWPLLYSAAWISFGSPVALFPLCPQTRWHWCSAPSWIPRHFYTHGHYCQTCTQAMRLIKLNLCFYLLGKGKHESQPWTKQQQIFWNLKGRPDISLKAQATLMAKCFVQGPQHVFYQIRIAHMLMNSVKQMALQLQSVSYTLIVRQRMATKQRLT